MAVGHGGARRQLAREIATISYRSGPEWEERFGRRRLTNDPPSFCPDFLIESYLDAQARACTKGCSKKAVRCTRSCLASAARVGPWVPQSEKFCLRYDPNSLIYISKAMDLFDMSIPAAKADAASAPGGPSHYGPAPSTGGPSCAPAAAAPAALHEASNDRATIAALAPTPKHMPSNDPSLDLLAGMARIHAPALVIGVQSDLLFPCWQQVGPCAKPCCRWSV